MKIEPILTLLASVVLLTVSACPVLADIGVISPADAKKLIENTDPKKRPVVLDTRGGYKDYFRGHLPTAHPVSYTHLTLPTIYSV